MRNNVPYCVYLIFRIMCTNVNKFFIICTYIKCINLVCSILVKKVNRCLFSLFKRVVFNKIKHKIV